MLNVLCKRDWCVVEMYPVWPIWSRDLAPSTLSTYPPPYLPGVMGTQFTGSLLEGWIWTVEWRFAASPTQILCFWIMYAILSLFHIESFLKSVYQMIGCLVLIAVIFLGWLTTTRNKRVSSCAFITFFLGCVANIYYIWFSWINGSIIAVLTACSLTI
jgi:hypothetical protein